MRLGVPLVIILAAGLMPGCLVALPFAYPTWSHTPELKVQDEVMALRVKRSWTTESIVFMSGGTEQSVIEAIDFIPPDGLLRGSDALGVTYGFAGIGWSIEVRRQETWLYRPGYQVITLGDPFAGAKLNWIPAHSAQARFDALRQISEETAGAGLIPGSKVDSASLEKYRRTLEREWTSLAEEVNATLPPDHYLRKRLERFHEWWTPSPPKGNGAEGR